MRIYRISNNKKLYILRGISGSGKSTLCEQLGIPELTFSADNFFMEDGEYRFNHDKIGEAHKWNRSMAQEAMDKGKTPIIIDNTNIHAYEMKPYVEYGLERGYEIQIVEPNTEWKFNVEELSKRNRHGVGKDVIQEMLDSYEHNVTVEDVLSSEVPKEYE